MGGGVGRMRKFSLLLMLVLLSLLTPAMAQEIYWAKEFKGKAYAVALAPNGDIIVAGITDSFGAGSNDVWVLRLDENGNVKWQKTYGGSSSDWAEAVTIAPDGDIIVAGHTSSFGAGWDDFWVLRLDKNGNVKWQKTYGGKSRDEAHALAIAPNGDIIVAGYTESFGAGGKDAWVLRLDEEGNVKWQKTYGGRDVDWADAVAIAPNGDIIVTGWTESFGAGKSDFWVLRLDKEGNIKWQKTYGGSGSDWAEAVTITPNGDIIVVGETRSFGVGDLDVWVLRLDENGNIKWQKTYGGTKSDWAWAVAITPNGDIIVAGITWSFGAGEDDFWVLRLDEEGNIKWQKTYGGWGVDLARAVAIAPDGDGVLGGDYVIRFNVDDAPLYEGDGWGNSSAKVKDSSAVVKHSNAEVGTSNAIVKSSSAKVTDVDDEGELLWTYTPGILRVSSTPSGAKVYVDGQYKGETPLELKLKPGVYTVKITKEGYEDYETRVEVKTGKTAEVSVSLSMQTQTPGEGASSSVTSGVGFMGSVGKRLLVLVGLLLLIIILLHKMQKEAEK